jgi:hypothetical protein
MHIAAPAGIFNTQTDTAAVELVVFQKASGILSKRLYLDHDGALVSDGSASKMGQGRAERLRHAKHAAWEIAMRGRTFTNGCMH